MNKYKILLAIPSYDCEKQIPRVIADLDDKLLKRLEKVIIIDDCGKDKTAEAAQRAIHTHKLPHPKVEVVQNSRNLGLGGTHKMAFLYGERMGADYVAILHGDDQAKAQELHRLLDMADADASLGAVLGCRFMKGSVLEGYSWQRTWGNRVINLIYSIVAFRKSSDLGSGLNLFRLADLADHRYLGFDDRMTFNIDLLLDYFSKKTSIKFVPITWQEEDQVTNARNISVARRAIVQLLKWRFGGLPIAMHAADEYASHPYRQAA